MYIAGINIHHAQGLEALIAVSTMSGFLLFTRTQRKMVKAATNKNGPVKSKTPRVARLATLGHAIPVFLPPVAYFFGIALNGFDRPEWMQEYNLPDEWEFKLGMGGYSAVRSLSALFVGVFLPKSIISTTRELGSQYSPIGVHEKATVVSTGAYAWVRHPMYASLMIAQPFFAAAFWSWIPLYGLAMMTTAFAVKIPYEEGLILEHAEVRDIYTEYKKKVPYRLVPFVW